MFRTFFLTFFCSVHLLNACYLHGSNTGECTEDSLDPLWRQAIIPYCKRAVDYTACVPKYQVLPASREFQRGRWFNHTTLKKDEWVQYNVHRHVKDRIKLERNSSLKKKGVNEYGDSGRIRRRFFKHHDCVNAYKNYFCWVNFPRCDIDRDLTLPMCRSACENYFISCNLPRDIWRCGKPKYFNGYKPEDPIKGIGGNVSYMRDYFPGQPFRENKFNPKGYEYKICTPAITGAASRMNGEVTQQWWILVTLVLNMALVALSTL